MIGLTCNCHFHEWIRFVAWFMIGFYAARILVWLWFEKVWK